MHLFQVLMTCIVTSFSCCGSLASDVMRDVIVTTPNGKVRGTRFHKDFGLGGDAISNTFDRFLGIPYAKSPTGSRRFMPPEAPEPWGDNVIRDARDYGPVCPQMTYSSESGADTRLAEQNEDCLHLDIYTPYRQERRSAESRYPVLVYVHGGSYEVGSGRTIDGSVLCQLGVVVISINYRLGALGFMSSGDTHLPGNYGILDQVQSLRWVHENIHAFRGDPSHVTVIGHSVGAASVGLLMVIPEATGLYHGIIAHSGVATALYSIYDKSTGIDFNEYVRNVGKLFDCHGRRGSAQELEQVVECLRTVPVKQFIDKRSQFPLYNPINPEFRPHVDGHVIKDVPKQLFARGEFNKIPFIIGTVRDEFGNYFSGGERYRSEFDEALDKYVFELLHNDAKLFELVKFQYNDWNNKSTIYEYQRGDVLSDMHMIAPTSEMADLVASYSSDIYQYHFSTPGNSYHSVDLNYVFGAPFSGTFADEMTVNGTMDLFTAAEKQLSRDVMKMWTSFAATGRPSTGSPERITWSRYTTTDRRYLLLSAAGSHMDKQLRATYVAFWNVLLPSLMSMPSSPQASTLADRVNGAWYTVALLVITVVLLLIVVAMTAWIVHRTIQSRRHQQAGNKINNSAKQ